MIIIMISSILARKDTDQHRKLRPRARRKKYKLGHIDTMGIIQLGLYTTHFYSICLQTAAFGNSNHYLVVRSKLVVLKVEFSK